MKPNIIYIFTDQQHHAAMSCVGTPGIHTPNLDRLAAEGVRFSRAYCAYPLCTPSRAAMFSGLMPHQVGVYENGHRYCAEAIPGTLGHVVAAAGYDCVYTGKWHIPEAEIPEGYGFRRIGSHHDPLIASAVGEFLKQRRDGDRPFFLVASYTNPHNICEYRRNMLLPYGPVEERPLEECPNLPPNYNRGPYLPEAVDVYYESRQRAFATRNRDDADQWRRVRSAYYQLCEKVDAEVGKLLALLDETGLADNTLVIFSSDHGDMNGARQLNQKCVLYEESVHVPFIMRLPRLIPAGEVNASLVSNGLDLYPTICDYAQAVCPGGLPGRSLRPAAETGDAIDRPWIAAETRLETGDRPDNAANGRMIVSTGYKYIVYDWGRYREELYDLSQDPYELVNLALEKRYACVLDEHRRALLDHCRATRDRFGAHYSRPGTAGIPGHGFMPLD